MSVFKQKNSKKIVLARRIELLMNDDLSQFSFDCSSARNNSTLITTNNTHKRVTQLVKEGELSRGLKALLSSATSTNIGAEEIQTMQMLHTT